MVILPVCQSCRITNGRKIFKMKNKNIKLKRRKTLTLCNGQMMQRKFRISPPTNSLYNGSNCHSFLHVQPSCLPKPLPSSPSHRSLAGVNRGSLKHLSSSRGGWSRVALLSNAAGDDFFFPFQSSRYSEFRLQKAELEIGVITNWVKDSLCKMCRSDSAPSSDDT